jgi:TonB family protein
MRFPLLVGFLAVIALEGQQPPPRVYKVGGGVSPPAVIQKVDPSYSPEALEAGLQGMVLLSVVVQTDGSATDLHVLRSLGLGLNEKAIEAVQKWRFRPGAKNGQAVPVLVTLELDFRLPTSTLDANLRPPDVAWLEIKPGKYEVTTTTAWDIPLKPSEVLSAFGPLDGLTTEQKAVLDKAKPTHTKTQMVCITTGSLNRDNYIPETTDISCRRSIVSASSTKREMTMQCGPPGNTTDLSVGFEAGAQDSFTASMRKTITRDTFKMGVTSVTKAKWVATHCTDSN